MFEGRAQLVRLGILVSICIGILTQGPLLAATEEIQTPKPAPVPRTLLTISDAEAAQLPPFLQEIRGLLVTERTQIEALTEQLATAKTNLRALELQEEISAVKTQTEISVMKTQARHAEFEGRPEQAATIREAVEALEKQVEARRARIEKR